MKKAISGSKRAVGIASGIVAAAILTAAIYYFAVYNSVSNITVEAKYASYDTVEAMEEAADLIIVGSPVKDFLEREHINRYNSEGYLADSYTLTDLQVGKVIKAPDGMSAKTLEMLQVLEPVGLVQEIDGKKKIAIDGYKEMEKNNEYIIFLKSNANGLYCVVNMNEGTFNLIDDHEDTKIDRNTVMEKYSDALKK